MAEYEPEYCEESFINQIIESEVYALVNEVFEELSPASREVYMKSLEGKSHKEIAEELQKTYKINVDKKKIDLKETIKELGMRTVEIRLYEGVIAKLKVNVVSGK